MRTLKIKLNGFIRAEVIEYYGERGVFIPLRYNAEERADGVFSTVKMRHPRRNVGNDHDMEGLISVPDDQRDKLLMSTRTFGLTQPVVFEYGTDRKKRGTTRKKLSKSELDELLGQ